MTFGATDLALVVMTFIWGSNFIVVKTTLTQLSPDAFAALRFIIASVLLTAFVWQRQRGFGIRRADWGKLALAGIIGTTFYQPVFVHGLALSPASTSALILSSTPILIVLLNRLLGRERIARRGWIGIALSFLGIAFVVESAGALNWNSQSLLGAFLILLCALGWSLYSIISAPLLRTYSSLSVTALSTVIGTVPLVLISTPALLSQDWSRVDIVGWSGVSYSGIFSIVVAYIIWNRGVQRLGSARTAIYNNLTPVVATLAAALFLNEPLTWLKIAGALVIFSGLYLARTASVVIEPEA